MRILPLFLILLSLNTKAQITKCSCEGFIDLNYKGNIILYAKPHGKIIQSLQQHLKEEDNLMFNIEKMSGNFFYVRIIYAINGTEYSGWIAKESYLQTYVRAYSASIAVLSSPNPQSRSKMILKPATTHCFTIIGCKGNFLKIRWLKNKFKTFEGWIKREDQCANPYTTCS